MAEAASTQAMGTMDPAHLDPVALHVHHENTHRVEDVRLIHKSTHTFCGFGGVKAIWGEFLPLKRARCGVFF